MAVFPEQMDRLNLQDPKGSLQQIEDYIRYMTERMEFANSNTTRVVTEAGVSNVGLYKTIITVADTVAIIQANMSNVINNTTALSQKVTEQGEAVTALSEQVTALQTAVNDVKASVAALTTRVEKLEGGTEA